MDGRAHSKCHLRWKSILPQESTVHLIDTDGQGHHADTFVHQRGNVERDRFLGKI